MKKNFRELSEIAFSVNSKNSSIPRERNCVNLVLGHLYLHHADLMNWKSHLSWQIAEKNRICSWKYFTFYFTLLGYGLNNAIGYWGVPKCSLDYVQLVSSKILNTIILMLSIFKLIKESFSISLFSSVEGGRQRYGRQVTSVHEIIFFCAPTSDVNLCKKDISKIFDENESVKQC